MFFASGALGECRRLLNGLSGRESTCTMRRLLNVPLGEERVGFRMETEVPIHNGDELQSSKVREREELVARVPAYRTSEIPNILWKVSHDFIELLGG